jgi:hypothetical protein
VRSYAQCLYAVYRFFSNATILRNVMLIVAMSSVVMLSVVDPIAVKLSIIMLSVFGQNYNVLRVVKLRL